MKKQLLDYCMKQNKEMFDMAETLLSAKQYHNIIDNGIKYANINNKTKVEFITEDKIEKFYNYITREIEYALCSSSNIETNMASKLEYKVHAVICDYYVHNKRRFTLDKIYEIIQNNIQDNIVDKVMVEGIIDKVLEMEYQKDDNFPIKNIVKDNDGVLVIEYHVLKMPGPFQII